MSGTRVIHGGGRMAGKATLFKEAKRSVDELGAALLALRVCLEERKCLFGGISVNEEELLEMINKAIARGGHE